MKEISRSTVKKDDLKPMDINIKFLGGAQTVTGSKYLISQKDYRLLIDCGLFQGLKELRLRNWDPFPIPAKNIDAIVLTHAHIDHSGYLPRLVREGYNGPIYCTRATASLVELLLLDAAKLQEEEAMYAEKKGYSKHNPPQPLFATEDAEKALSLLQPMPYEQSFDLNSSISTKFYNAGHILGSAIVELAITTTNDQKKLIFSGDLGRYNQPLLYDPVSIDNTDVLFIESTYGDRPNPMQENIEEALAQHINSCFENKGCVLIPAFAVGRTQFVLYYLHQLMVQKKIPEVPVYIDSPMAISATGLHKLHREDHRLSVGKGEHESIFNYKHFHYYRTKESSMSLNNVNQKAIIISASGMCTGGRILHHLYHRLGRKNDLLLFVGYQAEGTRGAKLVNGDTTCRLFGQDIRVNCQVAQLEGLSAHADQNELLHWAGQFQTPPSTTFVIHGESQSAKHLALLLQQKLHWSNVIVPEYLETDALF